jgi:lipopolysaccharide export LptBFGC system permease protein LptF
MADPKVDPASAREGLPTGEHHRQSDAERQAQGRRNIAIALAVLAFVMLVFATTVLRLSQNLSAGTAA